MLAPLHWQQWHKTVPLDGQLFTQLAHKLLATNIGTQWATLCLSDEQYRDTMCNFVHDCQATNMGTQWHPAMGNMAHNGTLRWETWQVMTPCDGELGMQWHHAMGNLACNGTLRWAQQGAHAIVDKGAQ